MSSMKNKIDKIKPRSVKFKDSEFVEVHDAAAIKNVSPHALMKGLITRGVKRIIRLGK